MISRVTDSLILLGSIQNEEQTVVDIQTLQHKAKLLLKKIGPSSPKCCSLEFGPYTFHYFMEDNVCFLCMCDKSFARKTAFSYLEDIKIEFFNQYSNRIATASRPYCFVDFEIYLQKAKKNVNDMKNRRNFSKLNEELQGIHRIMLDNLEDVLKRGEQLSELDEKAAKLKMHSELYRKQAKHLSWSSSCTKYSVVVLFITLILILIRYVLF